MRGKVQLYEGDCLEMLAGFEDDYADLIVTSPPYADRRKQQYGGRPADEYVKWFLPRAAEMLRVLKPTGTFILNIKEGASGGVRLVYVYELVLAMIEHGWLWIDELVWHKTNPFPTNPKNRLKDSWERCYQFGKTADVKIRKDNVAISSAPASIKRYESAASSGRDKAPEAKSGSGMYSDIQKFGRRMPKTAQHPNVLSLPVGCVKGGGHPAIFPQALPEFFIKLFTDKGDVVIDPFAGSGTTLDAAIGLGRKAIGIEAHPPYAEELRRKYGKI